MVCVDVSVERVDQFKAEVGEDTRVSLHRNVHGVDDDRLLGGGVGQQVGVGARCTVKQLPEQKVPSSGKKQSDDIQD